MSDIIKDNLNVKKVDRERPGLDFVHAAQKEISAILEGEDHNPIMERVAVEDSEFLTMPKKLAKNLAGFSENNHSNRYELFARDCEDVYANFVHFASRQEGEVLVNEKLLPANNIWELDAQFGLFKNLMMTTMVKTGVAKKYNTD